MSKNLWTKKKDREKAEVDDEWSSKGECLVDDERGYEDRESPLFLCVRQEMSIALYLPKVSPEDEVSKWSFAGTGV